MVKLQCLILCSAPSAMLIIDIFFLKVTVGSVFYLLLCGFNSVCQQETKPRHDVTVYTCLA